MPLPLLAIAAVASAGTGIANAITGTADANRRRIYEQNLGLLNFDQKAKLDKLLLEANSDEARQQILAQTLGSANTARIDALAKVQAEKEKTKKTLIIVGIGGTLLLVGLYLILKRK